MSIHTVRPISAERSASRSRWVHHGRVRVKVEPELRELQRDLGVQAQLLDPVEHAEVVARRVGRLRQLLDVLAQPA